MINDFFPKIECTPEVEETPQVLAPSVLESPIWNPIATVNWSLLFTPVFGAYLQMLNWKSLGQEDSARESKFWFYTSLIVHLILIFVGASSEMAGPPIRLFGFIYLVLWYYLNARNQIKWVEQRFGVTYLRKPWSKTILMGILGLVACVLVAIVIQPSSK